MDDGKVWAPIVNSGKQRVQIDAGSVVGKACMIREQAVEEIAEVNEEDLEASDHQDL